MSDQPEPGMPLTWRQPAMAYTWAPVAVGLGVAVTVLAVLIAFVSPHERRPEPIGTLSLARPLEQQLDDLEAERGRAEEEREQVEGMVVESEVARGMRVARLSQLDHEIADVDERAVTVAEVGGLRCEDGADVSGDAGPLEVVCEGAKLEDAVVVGWFVIFGLVSGLSLLALSAALAVRRRLLPWTRSRTRMLPAIVLGVAAIVAPPVTLVAVFFGRDSGYPLDLYGSPVHVGSMFAVVLFVLGVSVVLHVLLTASSQANAAVLLSLTTAGIGVAVLVGGPGPRIAAAVALAVGLVTTGVGVVLRRVPQAAGAMIVGPLIVATGVGVAAAWSYPGGWCWGLVVAPVAVLALPLGPQEQALRELLPQATEGFSPEA